jgi:hypothetical protein
MRVGVYVDGYNLYYGARHVCGRGTPGWRWLDIRALANSLVAAQRGWAGATVHHIVYCTARIDATTNPSGHLDQDVYIKAIRATGSVDHVEFGNYVSRVRRAPLAIETGTPSRPGRPQVVSSQWPVMVQDASGKPVRNALFMVSHLHNEEKGSDVNLASHLLMDVLRGDVDAAVVISNDSDLRLPVHTVRALAPVGHVNPRQTLFAGDLTGSPTDGAGNRWWRKLGRNDYLAHQLPDPAGGYSKPVGW